MPLLRYFVFVGGALLALFPALGLFDSQFLTRWQVSDHLQYLPLIAPVAFATGPRPGCRSTSPAPIA